MRKNPWTTVPFKFLARGICIIPIFCIEQKSTVIVIFIWHRAYQWWVMVFNPSELYRLALPPFAKSKTGAKLCKGSLVTGKSSRSKTNPCCCANVMLSMTGYSTIVWYCAWPTINNVLRSELNVIVPPTKFKPGSATSFKRNAPRYSKSSMDKNIPLVAIGLAEGNAVGVEEEHNNSKALMVQSHDSIQPRTLW